MNEATFPTISTIIAEDFHNLEIADSADLRAWQKINCTSWHLHYVKWKWDFSPAF